MLVEIECLAADLELVNDSEPAGGRLRQEDLGGRSPLRIYRGRRLYSARDLVNFLGCTYATTLDLRQLTDPVEFPPEDAQAKLLQQKGLAHERAYLERLRAEGRSVAEMADGGDLEARSARTLEAMWSGVDVVYQGALLSDPWHGYADFLLKVEGPSAFGTWAYDVADTKLSRSAKPSHVLQLCVYADLLARAQGVLPRTLHVVLGAGVQTTLRTSSVQHYYAIAKNRLEAFAPHPTAVTAEPCGHCTYCRWLTACEAEGEAHEHLSLVAGIRREQISKLRAAGIGDLRALAGASQGLVGHGLNTKTYAKLRAQAGLQLVRRDTGDGKIEILPLEAGKGFNRLPRPNPGDLFFDMEGDPLADDRLEYLFGFVHLENEGERFTPFWAHNRIEEKAAFEGAADFITAGCRRTPTRTSITTPLMRRPRSNDLRCTTARARAKLTICCVRGDWWIFIRSSARPFGRRSPATRSRTWNHLHGRRARWRA
jgi:predicted RecB family nuclease